MTVANAVKPEVKAEVMTTAQITPVPSLRDLALPNGGRKIANDPRAYKDSPLAEKARERVAFVLDRDGVKQLRTTPLKDPVAINSLVAAGEDLARRTSRFMVIDSSAQVAELAIDAEARRRSVQHGFNRPPPIIRFPDGSFTNDPSAVPEWKPINNPDAFVGFGSGIRVRNHDGAYIQDDAYDAALGGPAWRPNVEAQLLKMYPDGSIFKRLGRVDIEGEYPQHSDVDRLPYRFQVEDYGDDGLKLKDELMLKLTIADLRGSNMVAVDETSIKKKRYVTYIVPRAGTKERGVERLFQQVEVCSGVRIQDYEEIIMAGDTLTDFHCGMYGLPRAHKVTFILAADSELSEPLRDGHKAFANLSLMWSRRDSEMKPRYEPTEVPGVYKFKAHRLMPERTVILAHYAPWSRGLNCIKSLVATVDHLGYK